MTDSTISLQSVPATSKPKVPVFTVKYHGQNGEVFKLHLMNILMNIVTLGIYSFWGKTRLRKYMTSRMTLGKDRFEYTGTGKELFFGWIKAMVIFLPLGILMAIPVVNVIAYPFLFGIIAVAIYLALRYRLSRTTWRGIRFGLGGSIKEYLFLSLKRTLINVFTLGYKIPKSDVMKWSYIANHMTYGDIPFTYKGDASALKSIHLKTIFSSAGLMAVGFIIVLSAGMMSKIAEIQHHSSGEQGSSSILLPMLLFYIFFGAALFVRSWYHAALWREKFRGLRLGSLRFKCDIQGKDLAILSATNLLLVIVTLGLAKPIAANRTLRFFTSKIKIGGDINELLARQKDASTNSGAGDALAADVGFDLGL